MGILQMESTDYINGLQLNNARYNSYLWWVHQQGSGQIRLFVALWEHRAVI